MYWAAQSSARPRIFRPLPEPKPLCWHFTNKGRCEHLNCRFSHESAPAEAPRGPDAPEGRRDGRLYWLQQMPSDPSEYHLLTGTLEANGYRSATCPEEEARASLLWSGVSSTRTVVPEHCTLNRLGGGTKLTHKDRLVSTLRRGRQRLVAPLTFKLPAEREALAAASMNSPQTIWIVKRARSGRGRGIYVSADATSITGNEDSVVCRYIERPLLVNGYKHDLRIFVLVKSLHPLCAYLHTGGYVRFAAKKFSLVDIAGSMGGGAWDPMVHLTYLNSVNRQQHRIQRAKEWTVQQLLSWLRKQYTQADVTTLWSAIKQLVYRTVQCMPPPTKAPAKSTFELFGFDVLIDEGLRPWLLEVNSQPHLGSSGRAKGRVYSAEHEAKGAAIAATLTVGLADGCTQAELDCLACEVGFERVASDDVGSEWWDEEEPEGGGSGFINHWSLTTQMLLILSTSTPIATNLHKVQSRLTRVSRIRKLQSRLGSWMFVCIYRCTNRRATTF